MADKADAKDFLSGWTRFPMADGAIFVPPEGASHGLVRVREKLPQRRFRALVDEMIRHGGPAYAGARVGPLERFTTLEGEQAGLVTLEITGAERTVALVAGDDWSLVIDAATTDPQRFAAFRQVARGLAETSYLGLGEARQRRFEHTSPEGWTVIGRPHAVRYLHPRYPAVPTMITVFHARPRALSPSEQDERALMFESVDERKPFEPPAPLQVGPLTGHLSKFRSQDRGREILTARAFLVDARFLYRLHLECDVGDSEDALAVLLAVTGSLRSLPAARERGAAPAIVHWAD